MFFSKSILINSQRTYKNFGHKRQPIPVVTILWHGFLTCTFIGMGIEWKRISKFIFGTAGLEKAVQNSTDLKGS